LLHYPDGGLAQQCGGRLTGEVLEVARRAPPEGMVVFDPSGVTGHPDHAAATAAAIAAAELLDLPVLGWTLPLAVAVALNEERGTAFSGHHPDEVDYLLSVDRTRQRRAIQAHASQATPTSVLWRRLSLLGSYEHLRVLRTTPARNEPAGPGVTHTVGGIRT
jgi:LmbE family N-acetylglucosaminyl deacetylase